MAISDDVSREMLIRVRADITEAKKQLKNLQDEITRTGQTATATATKGVAPLTKSLDDLGAAARNSILGLNAAQKDIKKTEVAAASAAGAKGMSLLTRAFSLLSVSVAAYLALKAGQEIIREGDKYQTLTARIKTASKGLGDHVQIQKELEEIARRNGVALDNTIGLFQNLSRSAPELKASADDILTLTNAVQQLGVISGAAPANLSAGLTQFSQAMAMGVLQAQEFNSILENIPEVGQRIAKGLGMTVGQLRRAVLDGKVLAKDVFDAIMKQAPDIARQFKDIPDNVARSGEALSTAWTRTLGVLDRLIGGSTTLAGLFRSIERFLTKFGDMLDEPVSTSGSSALAKQIDEYVEKRNAAQEALDKLMGKGRGAFQSEEGFNSEKKVLQDRIDGLNKFITIYSQRANEVAEIDLKNGLLDRPGAGSSAPAEPSDEEKKRLKTIKETVDGLQQEAAEFGLTAEQVAVYRLQKLGATETDIDFARRAVQATEAMRTQAEVTKQNTDARKTIIKDLQTEAAELGLTAEQLVGYRLQLLGATDAEIEQAKAAALAAEAMRKHQDDMKKGKELIDATRTAAEKFNAESMELFRLYDTGALGVVGSVEALDNLQRGMKAAGERFIKLGEDGKSMFEMWSEAAKNWGLEFTRTLADAVLEGKLEFHDLTKSILRDLLSIQIQKRLTDPLVSAGTDFFDGLFGNVKAAGGGMILGPGTATSDSIPARLSNGEYVIQASAVRRYGEDFMAAINQMRLPKYAGGGMVRGFARIPTFSSGGPVDAAAATPGQIEVQIENRGAPAQVSSASSRIEADKLVLRVMLEDLRTGGPFSRELSNTYGMRRGG